ncbi:hypothetical protein A2Z33_02105 [Candidatus Gottesmanbacteria bacterium RBG_16_52_11]|uniref:ACT domain-containing protein n=1 Tax=Candidatus Gottesmanbacteria bacterium RBG_16_52_11 TaxID=1798374 RepID=A0A1F5YRQ7_9BACT|nr:MAG: hypothetical protein A2Z33_02105 [Candidatus Gottesmanbacteria bacterium RBG_16_52_11]
MAYKEQSSDTGTPDGSLSPIPQSAPGSGESGMPLTGYESPELPELPADIDRAYGEICDAMFGENGYLSHRNEEVSAEDRRMVDSAFRLAIYGHQLHTRGTGEPYIWHLLRIVGELVKMKVPARRVARMFLHDVVEDTAKPLKTAAGDTPYPFPVTREDIGREVGEDVLRGVDALTEKRKTQKMPTGESIDVKDIVETKYQIIRSGIGDPTLIIDKAEDRLDNIRTIAGKPPADQVNIAIDTFETYVPLARIVGLHDKAAWLEDACFAIIDAASHRDGFTESLTQLREKMSRRIGQEGPAILHREISEILTNTPVGFNVARVDIPGIFEMARAMDNRRVVEEGDFYLNVTVVLDDTAAWDRDQDGLMVRMNMVPLVLAAGSRYLNVPEDRYIGIADALRRIDHSRKTPEGVFRLIGVFGQTRVPLRIRVVGRTDYELERTPLSYLDAEGLIGADEVSGTVQLENRREMARKKHDRLRQQFTDMTALGMTHEEIVRQFVLTIPDSIVVINRRTLEPGQSERVRVAIPRGATVLDCALRNLPDRWWRITGVVLNGQHLPVSPESLSTELMPGDEVEFPDDSIESAITVAPFWLDTIRVDAQESENRVSAELTRRLQVENNPDLSEATRQRGIGKLEERFLKRQKERGMEPVPLMVNINKVEYMYRGALSEIAGRELTGEEAFEDLKCMTGSSAFPPVHANLLTQVVDALIDYQRSLVSITIPAKDETGVAATTSTIFAQAGINIEKIPVEPYPGTYNSVQISFVFEPGYVGHYLESVRPRLETIFRTDLTPHPWLPLVT